MQAINSPAFDIKVYRLIVPRLIPTSLLKYDPKDENKIISYTNNYKTIGIIDSNINENYLCTKGSYLQITTVFGKVYVGENLQVLLSFKNIINNELEYATINVINNSIFLSLIKVIIEYEIKKQNYNAKTFQMQDIKAGSDFYFPLTIQIEEIDQYIIILDIKYKEKPTMVNNQSQIIPTQEKMQQKKFRIVAKQPFELEFRATNIEDNYYIEYTIKNQSLTPLKFHKIEFRTLDYCHSNKIEAGLEESDLMTINVEDIRKYLFFVEIKQEYKENEGESFNRKQGVIQMGNLFLEYNTCGIFVGSTVTITVNPQDIKLELIDTPSFLFMNNYYQLNCKVKNNTSNKMDLTLKLVEHEMKGIKIFSISKTNLNIEPMLHESILLNIYCLNLGIHKICGIKAFNMGKEIKLGEIGDFFILQEEKTKKEEINLLE